MNGSRTVYDENRAAKVLPEIERQAEVQALVGVGHPRGAPKKEASEAQKKKQLGKDPRVPGHDDEIGEPLDPTLDTVFQEGPTLLASQQKRSAAGGEEGIPPEPLPFNLMQLGDDFTVTFVGKRRTGKTFCMRYFLHYMRDRFPRVYVFTATKINGFWAQYVPRRFIFDAYYPGVLEAIIVAQMRLIEWYNGAPDDEKARVDPRMVIVLDDVIAQDLHHDDVLKFCFFNGRHLKIALMITTQYAKGLPPGLRENTDLAVLFSLHSIAQREAAAENFLGHWSKKEATRYVDKNVWTDYVTQQRQCIVVDNSGRSPIESCLYICQPQEPEDEGHWFLGSPEYWGSEIPPSLAAKR